MFLFAGVGVERVSMGQDVRAHTLVWTATLGPGLTLLGQVSSLH